MKKMKRVFMVVLAMMMVLALAACGGGDSGSAGNPDSASVNTPKTENYRLAFGTSSTGSTYYILGTGWANIMQEKVPGVEISIEATPGGITNPTSICTAVQL